MSEMSESLIVNIIENMNRIIIVILIIIRIIVVIVCIRAFASSAARCCRIRICGDCSGQLLLLCNRICITLTLYAYYIVIVCEHKLVVSH